MKLPQQNLLDLIDSVGPGVGGHCIPIDPIFIKWAAKKLELCKIYYQSNKFEYYRMGIKGNF